MKFCFSPSADRRSDTSVLKKVIALFFAALLMLFCATPASARSDTTAAITNGIHVDSDTVLVDEGDFLSTEEERSVYASLKALTIETGWKIAVITSAYDMTDYESDSFSSSMYDKYFGADTSGILFSMDSANGNYVLGFSAKGDAKKAMSNTYIDDMTLAVMDPFEDYKEDIACYVFVDRVYQGYINYTGSPRTKDLTPEFSDTYVRTASLDEIFNVFIITLVIGVAAAGISAGIVWSRYHKHQKISAAAYLKQGSINIYNRSDRFIREFTTRTPRNNSSSGGGGRSGGGGGGRSIRSGGGGRGRR